jgi:hypothetical protein
VLEGSVDRHEHVARKHRTQYVALPAGHAIIIGQYLRKSCRSKFSIACASRCGCVLTATHARLPLGNAEYSIRMAPRPINQD